MHLKLVRWFSDHHATFGSLLSPEGVICSTLELPWRSNSRSVSCVPLGTYSLLSYRSRRHGSTFLFTDVPQRSGILFHPGNTVADSRGCILPVSEIVGYRGLRSREAHVRLLEALTGFTHATIDIVSA